MEIPYIASPAHFIRYPGPIYIKDSIDCQPLTIPEKELLRFQEVVRQRLLQYLDKQIMEFYRDNFRFPCGI